MNDSIEIKFQNHFKLYVSLKDKIVFESELIKNGIDFYVDYENQPSIITHIRYFLLVKDQIKIDLLLKETQIIASTETIGLVDYLLEKKIRQLYFKVFFIFTTIMILILIYDGFRKS